jgi:hypothetical protein
VRAAVCGVVSAGLAGFLLSPWFEVYMWDVYILASVPGALAVTLARPRGWPESYAWNAVAVIVGVAMGAATAAAIIDPSEHDSNLIFFPVVVFFFAGGLAFLGAVVLAPVAWGVSRIASVASGRGRD